MTLRLALFAVLAIGCANASQTSPSARSSAELTRTRQPKARLQPAPRLGPLAGAGSGVRRVDVALR